MRSIRLALLILTIILVGSTRGADVRFVAVTKAALYTQNGPGIPELNSTLPYQFRALVDLTRAQAITSATIKWPQSGPIRTLTNYTAYWEYSERFSTPSALNVAHPNGTYTCQIQAATDGRKTNTLTLSADVYPNPPHIANFAAAQAVDSRIDFTLQWDPPGTGPSDFIHVRVFSGTQLIFETGAYPGASGALNGSALSVVIPRNVLLEGSVYRGEITAWRKSTDNAGYAGVPAWAAYTRKTEFPIRTVFGTTDVHWFGFAKVQKHTQNNALAPALTANNAFNFLAFADATAALNVKAASLKPAGGTGRALAANSTSWRFNQEFNSAQVLDTSYPAGNFDLSIDTLHNGNRIQPLTLPLPAYYPAAAPQISNWNEANSFEAGKPFTVKWNPLSSGTGNDFVQVTLRRNGQVLFQTGAHPFATGTTALNGMSTSVLLPANLLQPGEPGELSILFLKPVTLDTFTYPRSLGFAGYGRETIATIRTRGGNVTAPLIRNSRLNAGNMELEIPAMAGRLYLIQGSPDLRTWTDLLYTNAPSALFFPRIPHNRQQHHLFLRSVVF
jgi:hypothetical protein